MILHKLTVTNFRQIAGHNKMRFAPVGDHNVTVVLGENGSGKTTLLNAFVWCLYGRVELENPNDVLSHKAVQEAPIGGDIDVEVTLVFDAQGRTYSATRTVRYRKLEGGEVEVIESEKLRVDAIQENGETIPEKDPIQTINQMLPDELSGFFFFRGEDMEALAREHSADRLRSGVERFLDFSIIDSAVNHLGQIAQDYDSELAKATKGAAKEITDKIAAVKEDLADAELRKETHENNLMALENQLGDIERQLSMFQEIQPLVEQKQAIEQRLTLLETQRTERQTELAAVISRDGFLWPKTDALTMPLELADAAISRGELPAKIKPQFIQDRLDMGECICGKDINDNMREVLLEWKDNTGLADLEAAIGQLRAGIRSLELRRDQSMTQVEDRRTALSETEQEITELVGERSHLTSQLEGKDFGIDRLPDLQAAFRNVNGDIVESKVAIRREADKIEEFEVRLEGLNDDRRDKLKEEHEAKALQERFDAVEHVRKALRELRSEWSALVQQHTDRELKEMWKQVAQLERLVEFTPDFHLSVKERGGDGEWKTSAASSANLRAISLSFVAALIQVAAEMGEDEEMERREQFFRGGKYPLVMDAPFAHMGHDFKSKVPQGLREVVPQVVVISSHDQWEDEVEQSLAAFVGAAYVLELHRPGVSNSAATVYFLGEQVDYVVPEGSEELDWSILQEVKA